MSEAQTVPQPSGGVTPKIPSPTVSIDNYTGGSSYSSIGSVTGTLSNIPTGAVPGITVTVYLPNTDVPLTATGTISGSSYSATFSQPLTTGSWYYIQTKMVDNSGLNLFTPKFATVAVVGQ